jgi:hypothetical protein
MLRLLRALSLILGSNHDRIFGTSSVEIERPYAAVSVSTGSGTKALSIRPPWAWAIAHARKRVENRGRRTKYRGPVAIHASKRLTESDIRHLEVVLGRLPSRKGSSDAYDPVANIGGLLPRRRHSRRTVVNKSVEITNSATILTWIVVDYALAIQVFRIGVPSALAQNNGHLTNLFSWSPPRRPVILQKMATEIPLAYGAVARRLFEAVFR